MFTFSRISLVALFVTLFAAVAAGQQVDPPMLSIPGGDYAVNQSLVVNCTTPGATIHYRTANSMAELLEPTENDPIIASGGSILIERQRSIGFKAFKTGMTPSDWIADDFRVTGQLAAGGNHTVALRSNGEVWAWGSNTNGELGDGTSGTTPRPTPTRVRTDASNYLSNVRAVAAGTSHTVALKSDGTVVAWGLNSSGQLGDGTVVQKLYPVTAKLANGSALTGITQIACGATHTLALKSDGTVWAWGANASGQIGDGTTTTPKSFATQVKVSASVFLTNVVSIAAGSAHSAVAKNDGTVWTWGLNGSGQLGNNTIKSASFPVQAVSASGALTSVSRVYCGANSTFAVDGSVWAWGLNSNGQLGDGTTTSPRKVAVRTNYPPAPPFLPNPYPVSGVNMVASGATHTEIMIAGGGGWDPYYSYPQGFGLNSSGQVGDGTTTQRVYPTNLQMSTSPPPEGSMAAGTNHSVSSYMDGSVWSWGANASGQLAQANTGINFTAPTKIAGFCIVEALADTDGDGLVNWRERELGTNPLSADTDGDGLNDSWEVTYGFNPLVADPPGDPDGDGFTNVQESQNGTDPYDFYNGGLVAFNPNGGWFVTEQSVLLSFITPSATLYYTKTGVTPTSSDKSTSPGSTLLIDRPLTLEANALKAGLAPTATTTANFVISGKVSGGATHSLALKSDGTLWAWGGNGNGQLGIGSSDSTSHLVPLQVKQNATTFLTGISFTASGASHSLAIKQSDGSVYAWGSDSAGQLGDNSTATQQVYPVQVKTTATGNPVLTGIVDIAGGLAHSIALKSDGTVWTWGSNSAGQLADGSTTTRKLAAQVKTGTSTFLTGIIAIGTGDNFCAALKSDGTVWTWGANASGQLGIGSTTAKSYATQVTAVGVTTDIACGATHMLALQSGGGVSSWGNNTNGQLGTGNTTQATSPVGVKEYDQYYNPPPFSNAKALAAGASHSAILKSDGSVYTFGLNSSGQLGIGSTAQQTYAVRALSNAGIVDVACGANHTLVTKNDGTVYVTGLNSLGQAGYSPTTVNPTDFTALSNFIIITAFADPDGDGLPTWQERELGTNPFLADSDGDGIPDGWEVAHALNPIVNDAAADPDGDGLTNLQEYAGGTDPHDYYNSQPFILAVTGGDGQRTTAGDWVLQPLQVRVTNPAGVPLANAPVTFSVIATGSGISGTAGGSTLTSLALRTDGSGFAAVYYRTPASQQISRVRVQATTGATVSEVRFSASTLPDNFPSAGLQLWLRGDAGITSDANNVVGQWADASGNSFHASQNYTSYGPLVVPNAVNGKSVLRFDGINKLLDLPNFMSGKTAGEMFVVMRTSATQPDWPGFMTIGTGGEPWSGGSAYPSQSGTITDDFGSNTQHGTPKPVQDLSQLHIYNAVSTATEWTDRVNGLLHYTTATNAVSFSSSPKLGYGYGAVTSGFFAGDFAEVLIFDRALSTADRKVVEAYLSSKYPDVASMPQAPTQPRPVRLSINQVSLSWRYNLGSVTTQFHVERKEVPGGTWTEIATIDNAQSYFDSTVAEGHSYAYRVRASNYRGMSGYSIETPELNSSTSRTSMPFNGLSLWLKADSVNNNSYVARWTDQSGRGQDAVTLDGNARPVFVQDPVTGTPVLRFDGASKVLNLPNFMSGKTAGEMFVVLRTSATQPTWPGFMTIGTGGQPWDNGSAYPTQGGTIRDDFGSNREHDIGTPYQDLTHFHIHNVVSTASEWTARTNGKLDYSTTTNTVSYSSSPQIGYGYGAVVSGYFAGDLAEILIFDHALSAQERERVHWYLAEKFALDGYDLDDDGLSNAEELAFGTDPLNPDTNGDGISDGASIRLGINPLGAGYAWPPSPQPAGNPPLNFILSDPPGAVLLP
jgi:alpha-tubulin suppressor-like RCC1 family protein